MSFCKDDGNCEICGMYNHRTATEERDHWTETKDQKAENQ